jgi:E3 ubiquitin-protein ligase SIAH1
MTKVKAGEKGEFKVSLNDGFNFLVADCPTGNKQGATTSFQYLLLLIVARQLLGRTISVLCIDPHAATTGGGQEPTSKEMECKLWYVSPYAYLNRLHGGNPLIYHYQLSTFRVVCTNLSNGMPKPEDCFQFLVPASPSGEHDKDGIQVTVRIAIK